MSKRTPAISSFKNVDFFTNYNTTTLQKQRAKAFKHSPDLNYL